MAELPDLARDPQGVRAPSRSASLAYLAFQLVAIEFRLGARNGIRSLVVMSAPLLAGAYLFVTRRGALGRIRALPAAVRFAPSLAAGALAMASLPSFLTFYPIPIAELLVASCIAVLVFGSGALPGLAPPLAPFGIAAGMLAYVPCWEFRESCRANARRDAAPARRPRARRAPRRAATGRALAHAPIGEHRAERALHELGEHLGRVTTRDVAGREAALHEREEDVAQTAALPRPTRLRIRVQDLRDQLAARRAHLDRGADQSAKNSASRSRVVAPRSHAASSVADTKPTPSR